MADSLGRKRSQYGHSFFNTEASERDFQVIFCDSVDGGTEVVLRDRTRVDCLTTTHAIEVDFAKKWAEAIGQALHYALMTNRTPGVALIVQTPRDLRHWNRLNAIARNNKPRIKTWCIGNACPDVNKSQNH